MTEPLFVGIDFGTTNSAIAVARGNGAPRLLPLPNPAAETGTSSTWRTVLYFEPGGRLSAGAEAIARYRETQGEGRLIQSIKSHLASASFARTTVFGRRWTIEDMIAAFLRQIRQAVAAGIGELGSRCVIGRPVRYWGAETADDDARAVSRMTTALASAGFTEVVFVAEPVAAASAYAARLTSAETIVVADFGGGTTDFSVVRVGGHGPSEILATGGVGISGDAFDARIIDETIAPAFGKGSKYRDEMGAEASVPAWVFNNLRRWHYLSFLKEPQTQRLLHRVVEGSLDPLCIERLRTVIDDDLGLVLHQAVETAKLGISSAMQSELRIDHGVDLKKILLRQEFENWIAPDLAEIDDVLTKVLADASLAPNQVDRVFATGGASLTPAVRTWLAKRFGAEKLVGGEELTSVASGLAAQAQRFFGG
ncbi:MAG: Hsp70 family protein [Kofleriaceae bacterium]|nr:Hsp70 family protein [Kofleriaceae bacterium]